jgi:peptidoglycan hydrolase-like protein with peptidoglycan-binding domain
VIAIVAGVAVASTAIGFVAGTRIVSPAEAAARREPPAASPVTVPVELREIKSEVITRGDVVFEGARAVQVETGALGDPPVVTGAVPKRGATLGEADVVIEVAGRPVIALEGKLPAFRSLGPGSRGPDVVQLEKNLSRLGFDPGAVDGKYDKTTGIAVADLFREAGYQPPKSAADKGARLAAQSQLANAEAAVAFAEASLELAQAGVGQSEILAVQAEVNAARRVLRAARSGGGASEVAAAEDQLAIAKAHLLEVQAAPNTAGEQAALAAAQADLEVAHAAVARQQASSGTPLPASEIVFLPRLPRRIDEVEVALGDVLEGPMVRVSGTELIVKARVGSTARQLINEGMAATITHLDQNLDGHIAAIRSDEGGGSGDQEDAGGLDVTITLEKLGSQQVDLLREANVKVSIPVGSTEGKVLAVPLAAVSAGPGGESRVEVQRAGGGTEVVVVDVGLSAEGYVEILPPDQAIRQGDLVVVGRTR